MAQINHRTDLTQQEFPLISSKKGRSVLVSSFRNAPTGERGDEPEVIYAHNVMPVDNGYLSIGFEEVIPDATDVHHVYPFDDVRIVFSTTGERVYIGFTEDLHVYVLHQGDTAWSHVGHASFAVGSLLTIATVKGQSYIYLEGYGCYEYNSGTTSFVAVTLTGMPISNLLGITASSGYMLAFNASEIAWSSTVSPEDFTPSSITGAGFGSVSDLEGDINFAVPNSLGLLIYTAANVVAAIYTGNKQYPFKYKSVDDSKGALGIDAVAYEANAADHFAYTKAGLQTVNSRKAATFLPHFTDFLAGKVLEDFDEITNTFSYTELTGTMKKKVKYIASRYLIISYGITEFTHALIYDVAMQRLGKVKITHYDVFEYLDSQVEVSKESIAFLTEHGAIQILKFSPTTTGRNGVLALGKYQYTRDRHMILQSIIVEEVESTDTFSCVVLSAIDGKNTSVVTPKEYVKEGYREYKLRQSAVNHTIVYKGAFNLNTSQINFSVGGRR